MADTSTEKLTPDNLPAAREAALQKSHKQAHAVRHLEEAHTAAAYRLQQAHSDWPWDRCQHEAARDFVPSDVLQGVIDRADIRDAATTFLGRFKAPAAPLPAVSTAPAPAVEPITEAVEASLEEPADH